LFPASGENFIPEIFTPLFKERTAYVSLAYHLRKIPLSLRPLENDWERNVKMRVRFGYVAIALNLQNVSTSKTITLTNLQKLPDAESKKLRLMRLVKENLDNIKRVILYNRGEGIHVYRLTSKVVPFATYPLEFSWDYLNEFAPEFKELGNLIRDTGLRVSAHPDHFTVINTPDERVFAESVKDLEYHQSMFAAMGLDNSAKLVTHVGGFYKDKPGSILRFKENFSRLPEAVQGRITLENDDKIYTLEDVLAICQEIKIPMVFDLHHHQCNPKGDISQLLGLIWETWSGLTAKIHVSSPKCQKEFRHHADYVAPETVWDFLQIARKVGKDFDVMVEAKMKDQAMFRLVRELSQYPEVTLVDPTTLEIPS
ncbi:MAG TPA: UV DNA damage repair endonuclease UvsE, partial [Verrucomicrobiae bacterium]|nr:UV DNA damage repair endonuclease UvsE [Verrucomicrobiae bacterium]